jgi:hypothetical protein
MVTLVKHATKAFELNFSGKLPVVWAYRDGKPEKAFDFRFVGKDRLYAALMGRN